MIIQQVDLVNIKQTAICACQHAWLKMTLAFLNGLFYIECPHHTVFRRGNGQVYKGCRFDMGRKWIFSIETFLTFCTPGVWLLRVAAEAAVIYDSHFGEQCGQCTRRSGFRCAAFTTDQHAADTRINSVQDERTFHALLSYDCSKGEN